MRLIDILLSVMYHGILDFVRSEIMELSANVSLHKEIVLLCRVDYEPKEKLETNVPSPSRFHFLGTSRYIEGMPGRAE